MTDQKTGAYSKVFLYVAVFFSGMTTLAVELSASRLLGNVFGTSNLVWANVIGLMLLYLTIGYFLGGWIADRSPHPATLYQLIVWGAFLCALIPLVSNRVLFAASRAVVEINAGVVVGAFISVIALFAVPITLLGTVSPFAIRLAVTDVSSAGKISGRIYAISTLGSILGTFLPVLVFIPLLGTTQTFLVFSSVLFIVGCIGLWQSRPRAVLRLLWMPGVVALVFVFTGQFRVRAALSPDFTVLYEGESAYNYIQVQEHMPTGYRFLFLNEGQGIHSQWHPEIITYDRTWSYFLTAPYFNAPSYSPEQVRSVAVVGLAAGTIPRQHI
ncbi:MAG: fused MFS/spermidine synthase, partial [Chloroflexota bacterium]